MRNGKICHLWAELAIQYQYQKGGYRYPLDRGKEVSVPIKVVPIPIHQQRIGTGIDQSGTGTNASSNPDFCTLALLSPIFVH